MSLFLRLLDESDKAKALSTACDHLRFGQPDINNFEVAADSFEAVPGRPFAYWVSDTVLNIFRNIAAFEDVATRRVARRGVNSNDDYRFLRCSWEVRGERWMKHPKGGVFSRFYADIHLVLDWFRQGEYLEVERQTSRVYSFAIVPSKGLYFRPGVTWSRRTQGGLSLRAMPAGCIFADKGPAAFVENDDPETLLALLALVNSRAFGLLVSLQMAFGSYEVGVIQKTPVPNLTSARREQLAGFAHAAWSLKRTLDTTTETSHAFLLPSVLRTHLGRYDPPAIEAELAGIQAKVDAVAFDLYGFTEADRAAAQGDVVTDATDTDEDDAEPTADVPLVDALLSWAVGVAFGRFDWRLATGEREAPPEPEPFDPLPDKSPGMLPGGAEPFHHHAGILVDDRGHPDDLPRLLSDVLERVDAPVDDDLRRWLRRDFFKYHLQQYSKSRRKAPIYWPLATASGSYTLWLYYPELSDQTLFTAVNDYVEPKLKQVQDDLATLRSAGANRSKAQENELETLSDFAAELADLRDTLLQIAPGYKPNQDDGVQITAAPLWPLFRHKPWQKALKETWQKLEDGDYDWAHLALAYWPARVRAKCESDKSLAIAHDLEHLYIEPEKTTQRKNTESRG